MIVGRVPSFTDAGEAYEIEQVGDALACSCPAFAFGKRRGKTCKHLRVYLAARDLLQKCRAAHGGDGRALCGACLLAFMAAAAAKVRRAYRPKEG